MVAVEPGQRLARGHPLLTLEALKMETMLHAERAATVLKVHVKPGSSVSSKDLLIEID